MNTEEIVFSLNEVYSIDDYNLFEMINTCIQQNLVKENINPFDYVRVIFCINNKDKEISVKKSDLLKVYSFIKIIYNDKEMIILTLKGNYSPNAIIEKINSKNGIKGFIKMKLNIFEYPLTNYYLEEFYSPNNNEFEKIFLLKYKQGNSSQNNQMQIYNDVYKTNIVLNQNNLPNNNINNNMNNPIYSSDNANNNNNNSNNNNGITNNYNLNNNTLNNNNNTNIQNYQINANQNFNNNNINNNCQNSTNNNNINCNINQNNFQNNNCNQQLNNNTQTGDYNQNNMNNYNSINNMPNQSFNNNNNSLMNQNYNNMSNMCFNFMYMNMNSNSTNNTNLNNMNMNSNSTNNTNLNNMNIITNSNTTNNMNFTNPMNMNIMQNSPNPIYNNIIFNNKTFNNMNINQNLNIQTFNTQPINNNQNNNNQNNNMNTFDIKLLSDNISNAKILFPFVGLRNVGLTCYMNSTLQCLLHIPELNNYFLNIYPQQENRLRHINKTAETRGKLSQKYFELIKDVNKNSAKDYLSSNKISPNAFHNAIGMLNPQFRTFDANDSKDLLLFLFQSMHEELNYYGDKKLQSVPKCNQTIPQQALDFFMKVNNELNLSIFSYLFYGIFKSETECLQCHTIYYNFQYFQIISFPLYKYKGDKFNIYKGFKDFVQKEEMRGDNQCYCQHCKILTNSDVKSNIYYTPPYLIINLDYGKNKKYVPKQITFGETLDLTGFTEAICTQRTYQLIAVSSHIGKSGITGHYIAYCKNQSKNDSEWYEFNDSSVSKSTFDEIKDYSPYFLIFKKINN